MSVQLTLALAGTIRHDGNGGVTDDLADTGGLARWLRDHAEPLRGYDHDLAPPADLPDERTRLDVVALRRAVRTLLARAVAPAPPSRADHASLLTPDEAVRHLNDVAGRLPTSPRLHWPADGAPILTRHAGPAEPRLRLTAALARAAVDFLAGPEREQLRACPAPRCVRYFVREHARQQWCKPSCGNRARVARHYQRQQAGAGRPADAD
ncbi:ABATE domain-containing protein [Micromonospora sp. C28SCA-DRY-2]|uniref:CGNR zinc finger domain-containing protein n=1 Tax=Micromonospora sp. C28SCA-DRY-2 TaxID=3059522 RepID=UPI002674E295|nr:ABATE domain-containing protein [Micromonospora sp. C28SCA-DRY-2]MDO3705084.1 ABATE domain-containing protein [Micromonospora sp. C28SCA-DRY-2]